MPIVSDSTAKYCVRLLRKPAEACYSVIGGNFSLKYAPAIKKSSIIKTKLV